MEKQVKEELTKINALLRDSVYAYEMAKALDSAYYEGEGQVPAPFLAAGEDTATVTKKEAEEKIATSIAAFYALECGVGVLCEQKGGTPVEWITKTKNGTLDSGSLLLLNRFANAAWKAGQPFRSLNRITRSTFTVANFLPEDEVKKDEEQVRSAAVKLAASMQEAATEPKEKQVAKLQQLLQSRSYAFEMAKHQDSAYYVSQNQAVPAYPDPAKDTVVIKKSVKEQKIAVGIAGFYALECAINYFVTTQHKLPSEILISVKNNTMEKNDKTLLLRFANATWKAGQPFRSLDRIERYNFIPASLLDEKELNKDYIQVKAAAIKLLQRL